MRIITQNILKCNVKSCRGQNPALRLKVTHSEIIETPFNSELIRKTLSRCDYPNLVKTVRDCGDNSLPEELTEAFLADESRLRALHNILYQLHVVEGQLICEKCQRIYRIEGGIPNMLLDQSEIN